MIFHYFLFIDKSSQYTGVVGHSVQLLALLLNQGARISVNSPVTLTKVLRDFQESFNANAGLPSALKRAIPHPSMSFPIHHLQTSHCSLSDLCSFNPVLKEKKRQAVNQLMNQSI